MIIAKRLAGIIIQREYGVVKRESFEPNEAAKKVIIRKSTCSKGS